MSKQKTRVSQNKNALPAWLAEAGSEYCSTACVVSFQDKQFMVCNGDNALLFRHTTRNLAGWTYFVYDSVQHNAYSLDADWFAEQYQAKQFGRVVAVPVIAESNCKWIEKLYFRPDGTGFVWPGAEQVEFSWVTLWDWPVDVVDESVQLLFDLGRIVFDSVNATLENPLIDPETLQDEPLEFISGSPEELERVTRWICHSNIGKPKRRSGWDVIYSAPNRLRGREGGLLEWTFRESAPLREIFNLAYEYNAFTGYHWEYNDEKVGHKASYDPQPLWLSFEFHKASRDEEQAARKELRRWLGGKMTAAEIQFLLGNDDTS